jgi:hypothetical protein
MVPKIRTYNNSEVMTGKCKKCGTKPIEEFPIASVRNNKTYYRNMCHICFLEFRKQYRILNKHQDKNYKIKNKNKISEYGAKYYQANKDKYATLNAINYVKYKLSGKTKEYSRKYNSINREKINAEAREKFSLKRKKDLNFRINSDISRSIRYYLKINGGSKNRKSCRSFLPFTVEELKKHIESLFEPWMTWDNRGQYHINSWDDNDQSTWTWNIDHIIPQSKLPYASMEDDNFKKCWSLQNLRPLSSKQNLIDGGRRDV